MRQWALTFASGESTAPLPRVSARDDRNADQHEAGVASEERALTDHVDNPVFWSFRRWTRTSVTCTWV